MSKLSWKDKLEILLFGGSLMVFLLCALCFVAWVVLKGAAGWR